MCDRGCGGWAAWCARVAQVARSAGGQSGARFVGLSRGWCHAESTWRLGCSVGRWSINCEGGGACGVPRGGRLGFAGGVRNGPRGYVRCIASPWCSDGRRLMVVVIAATMVAGQRVVFRCCGLLAHGAGRWRGKAIGPLWVGRGSPGERIWNMYGWDCRLSTIYYSSRIYAVHVYLDFCCTLYHKFCRLPAVTPYTH
jgi:hypothetical protein